MYSLLINLYTQHSYMSRVGSRGSRVVKTKTRAKTLAPLRCEASPRLLAVSGLAVLAQAASAQVTTFALLLRGPKCQCQYKASSQE